jgi:hypothetical protein
MDLSNVSEALMTFDLAYAKRNTSAVSELLIIEASTNCKRTYRNLMVYNEQTGIVTHNVPSPNWVPTSSNHWVTKSINLEDFIGEKNVHIRFRAVSRSGNSIFIDNLRLENSLSTDKTVFGNTHFKIYPNPNSAKQLTIERSSFISDKLHYGVKDLSGKVILSGVITNPKEIISIAALNQGVYFVSLNTSSSNQLYTQKLVIIDN